MNHFEVGELVGNRFEIISLAAIGGMGSVYRARDRVDGGDVAVKIIHATTDPAGRERFYQEAALVAGFDHPAIVRYITLGELPDGRPFLVMEWVEGESLARRLGHGALALPDCLRLMRRLTEALSRVHERGVIHRDLKPSNIMLRGGRADDAVVLDFGIARHSATVQRLTRTGSIIGTPEYMAPEQASGVLQLTAAADVFSLGCVLYECLVGHPPFVAEYVPAVLIRILFEEPRPVSELRSGVPAHLSALVSRMLAKCASDRPRDASELLSELHGIAATVAEEAAPQASAPPPRQRALTGSEQQLFCIIIAAAQPKGQAADTLKIPDARHGRERRSTLPRSLQRMGARAEWLADGSLVGAVAGGASATDQVAAAARCALIIKRDWPEAHVVLATGRAELHDRLPLGEAVDRATSLLYPHGETPSGLPPGDTSTGVWLDRLSARLLPARFSRVELPQGVLLHGEELEVDETRTLLGRPTPCVGREGELAQLRSQWARSVSEPAAGAILIVAPPGAGKSRLRYEFVRRIEAEGAPFTLLLGRGDSLRAGLPYDMLGQALRQYAGLQNGASPAVLRKQLARQLGLRIPEPARRVVEFLGELCGVPFPEHDSPPLRAARSEPRVMRDQIQHAFLDWLRAECAARPVLLILEDLQWGDALSVQIIEVALRELGEYPFLVVATARPEVSQVYPNLWAGHVGELHLSGLSRRACGMLVKQVLASHELTQTAVDRLVERSAGNALYLEELIRAAAKGDEADGCETVLAMLQVRLARLSADARLILRAASIFGETFWSGGARALCQQAEGQVAVQLDVLVKAEVIKRRRQSRFAGEMEFEFRHALVCEAAYGMLTAQDRSIGHRLASEYLERAGEMDAMLIAEHARLGGALERATPFYVRAAEHSCESGDFAAVLDRTARGLSCGAIGEMRGILRALQSYALFWRAEWGHSDAASDEALALLPRGSLWWCRAIQHKFAGRYTWLTCSLHVGACGSVSPCSVQSRSVEPGNAPRNTGARGRHDGDALWRTVLGGAKVRSGLLCLRPKAFGRGGSWAYSEGPR